VREAGGLAKETAGGKRIQLDVARDATRRGRMDDRTQPTSRFRGAAPAPRDAAREARRAEALRINLRRRKAGASAATEPPAAGER
jgi:hypothetical protein